jgi:hypothetical protein
MSTDPESSAQEKIRSKATPTITQIPFSIVDRPANKTTRLLANATGSAPIEGQNRWHSFEFNNSIFVYRIVINETNYPEFSKFEIEVTNDDGEVLKSNVPPSGSKVQLIVNCFCKSVRFRPPKSYSFQSKTIDSVEIFGFEKSNVGRFLQFARDIDALKDNAIAQIEKRESAYQLKIEEAEKAEARANEAKKETSALKSQADRQRTMIRQLESERADLTTKVGVLEDTLKNNNRLLDAIRYELDNKTKTKKSLDEEVYGLNSKLSELRANLDLFPSELESFVTQGRKNTRTLFWLALTPIVVIVIMFGILISGAADLTTKIDPEGKINIVALVASRTPYLAVALAIITACYKIARVFIFELIEINRQRLNLTKVSIIAKDISAASETGLELSEVERYGLRVRLKMELLKDHLKGYISPDFQISLPTKITNYLPFSNILEEQKRRREEATKENLPPNDDVSQ